MKAKELPPYATDLSRSVWGNDLLGGRLHSPNALRTGSYVIAES